MVRSSMAFHARGRRRGPRRGAERVRDGPARSGAAHRGADRGPDPANGGGLIGKARGHVYNEWFKPPRVMGRVRHRRLRAAPGADDAEATVRAPDGGGARAAQRGRRLLPRPGHPTPVDGLLDRGRGGVAPRRARPPGHVGRMITRKSARESTRCGRPADVARLFVHELRPGVTTGHLDDLAERHIRASGGIPSFKGYLGGACGKGAKAFPASTCISIDARWSMASPATAPSAPARSCQSTSARCRRLARRRRSDLRCRRGGARGPGTGRRDAPRDHGRHCRGAGGRADRRHLRRDRGRRDRAAMGSSGRSSATGSDGDRTRTRQVPNYRTGSRGAELQPGICPAIEPMFTLGDGEVYVEADGWQVEPGRQPRRALRAHDRHHGARPRNPDHHLVITNVSARRGRYGWSDAW